MNERFTSPSPISYGMQYERARYTGQRLQRQSSNQLQTPEITVGDAPTLAADVKSSLGLR